MSLLTFCMPPACLFVLYTNKKKKKKKTHILFRISLLETDEENMDLTYSSAYQYDTVHSVTQHLVRSFLLIR